MYKFKVSKKKNKNRTTCQVYSKLTLKTPEQPLALLFLTWAYICEKYIILWTGKICLSNIFKVNIKDARTTSGTSLFNLGHITEKYIILWTGKFCWAACFLSHSPYIRLIKDEFS